MKHSMTIKRKAGGCSRIARLTAMSIATSMSVAAVAAAPAAHPDLTGTWLKVSPQGQTLTPIGGPVPFTAEGAKQYEKNKADRARGDYDAYDIATSRCSHPGTPRIMLTAEPFKIWERFGVYTLDFKWNRVFRQLDGSTLPPPPDPMGLALVPGMAGSTKAHWEGDTLVAETTNISDRTLIDDLVPHGTDLKVTERFRLVGKDQLEDRLTIEDPATFKRPWNAVIVYKRQPATFFAQDICLDRHDAHQPAFPVK